MGLKHGSDDIVNLYSGSTPINRVYSGSDKVWDRVLVFDEDPYSGNASTDGNGTWAAPSGGTLSNISSYRQMESTGSSTQLARLDTGVDLIAGVEYQLSMNVVAETSAFPKVEVKTISGGTELSQSLNGLSGSQSWTFTPANSGEMRIEVTPFTNNSGQYVRWRDIKVEYA